MLVIITCEQEWLKPGAGVEFKTSTYSYIGIAAIENIQHDSMKDNFTMLLIYCSSGLILY